MMRIPDRIKKLQRLEEELEEAVNTPSPTKDYFQRKFADPAKELDHAQTHRPGTRYEARRRREYMEHYCNPRKYTHPYINRGGIKTAKAQRLLTDKDSSTPVTLNLNKQDNALLQALILNSLSEWVRLAIRAEIDLIVSTLRMELGTKRADIIISKLCCDLDNTPLNQNTTTLDLSEDHKA